MTTTSNNPLGAGERQSVEHRLVQGADELGLELAADQRRRLLHFLDLLVRWNRSYNLTAVRDPVEMVSKHLLDSLSVLPYLLGDSLLDIGTGAGLPGLPLAILEPERRFWLLDGNGKKIRFVRQAVLELGLANVEPVQARLETYQPGRRFTTILSRAVAAVDILDAPHAELLERPGRLLLMKGRQPEEDLDAAWLSSEAVSVHRLHVPFLDAPRHLIDIQRR